MWYLTGFLVPSGTPRPLRGDDDAEDDWDAEVPERAGLEEESTEDGKRAKRGFFPSSMGLSFLVYPDAKTIRVAATWGDYRRGEGEDRSGKAVDAWVRAPRSEQVEVALDGSTSLERRPVPGSDGLVLHVAERRIRTEGLGGRIESGTRAVSVFLVNERRLPAKDDKDTEERYAFQARLAVAGDKPFHPRPDLSGRHADEWDRRVADLHFADTPAYATGHGVSADWTVAEGVCTEVRTSWIGSAEVEATRPEPVDGVELSMRSLSELADGPAARAALEPLVTEYRTWIEDRAAESADLEERHRATASGLLANARNAANRMARGVTALAGNPDALDAFRMANRAVQRALTRRIGDEDPRWRPFQLAFLLLNLPGMADPGDDDRETVDLLFFPTGGGKTEAYLGLAAFAMVYRRLRNPAVGGRAGAGVCVVMRYTLRLLTLDQLSRASSLVCALELERAANPERYGEWPFEIGLWVGKAATPNRMGRKGDKGDTARRKTLQYRADPRSRPAPIPIENCPWCGERFTAESFGLLPDADRPRDLRVGCTNIECEFSGGRQLPIVAVDEPLYRRLPAFLIATVDKFAALPWEGPSGALLGGAERFDEHGFYGASDPGRGSRLDAPLLPPDLVIQDELHLITGPLGTMMGLYETAIEGLCTARADRSLGKPKIVASTATARKARDQVQAVFARADTEVFPPPGPDRRDSFFARTVDARAIPARRYLGIAATGRNPKVVMRRALLALMAAAEKHFVEAGGRRNEQNPADPYMTLLAYFNSLRELGGARRIVEEEIQNTLRGRGQRRRLGGDEGLFRDRTLGSEVLELTSRVPTDQVAAAFERLGRSFHQDGRVDCALATNMISVGLDVSRLGLMVVNGQPKTHAEYIQATSRVGRDPEKPGLVVTLLNIHKPRDRSHYERFRHYHETFYRSVESASATPFSARALDRGLAGTLVGLARHLDSALTPAHGAEAIRSLRPKLEERLTGILQDRVEHQPIEDQEERQEAMDSVRSRLVDLLDSWTSVLDAHHQDGVRLQYQRHEKPPARPLLHHLLDPEPEDEHERKFRLNRSLRDVEPEVHVYVKNLRDARSAR